MVFSRHSTLTARLRRFSSCDGEDSASTEYDCDGELFKDYFRVTFYANGSCSENEGHVSIVFNVIQDNNFFISAIPLTFSCTASVIDASGNKRFPQSFALDLDYLINEDRLFFTKGFGFNKFVKRSTLLNDSQEMLPDDCLTLCLDIEYEVGSLVENEEYDEDYADGIDFEDGRDYLRMDTEFGRELCQMSTVFRDMMEFTTVESGDDRIPISPVEYIIFEFIHRFLREFTLHVQLSGMFQVYLLADKYDMQPIVEQCHRLLISVLREMNTREKLEFVDKDMHLIIELAEKYVYDERLREILAIYSDIKKNIESGNLDFDTSDDCKLETEWNCKYRRRADSSLFLEFSKNKVEHLETYIHK